MNDLSDIILSGLAASGVIVLLVQAFKRWLKTQRKWVITLMLATFSVAAGVMEFALTNNIERVGFIAPYASSILGATKLIYDLLVKPANGALDDFRVGRALRSDTVARISEELIAPVAEAISPATPADFEG